MREIDDFCVEVDVLLISNYIYIPPTEIKDLLPSLSLPLSLAHSILYHSIGQPKDSLQAYLCALYLEPHSLTCWSDLGCLYEAVSQPL